MPGWHSVCSAQSAGSNTHFGSIKTKTVLLGYRKLFGRERDMGPDRAAEDSSDFLEQLATIRLIASVVIKIAVEGRAISMGMVLFDG